MKKNKPMLILVATFVAAVIFEESRIRSLQKRVDELVHLQSKEKIKGDLSLRLVDESSMGRSRSSIAGDREKMESSDQPDFEGFGKAMRKMAENPAAKAMFESGHIAAAKMVYQSLLDDFDLSEEEEDYFLKLLAGEFADQQQMGMQMMGLESVSERRDLVEAMEAQKEERKEMINEFLNNEEDAEAFNAYHDRLPEHQQMNGIRAAIAQTGSPLSGEQESQLIEVMHHLRTSSSESKKWEGAGAVEMFSNPEVVEVFETDWARGQEALKDQVGFLDDDQQKAFFESQNQMKEMHLMGIKMMQSMMKSQSDE